MSEYVQIPTATGEIVEVHRSYLPAITYFEIARGGITSEQVGSHDGPVDKFDVLTYLARIAERARQLREDQQNADQVPVSEIIP